MKCVFQVVQHLGKLFMGTKKNDKTNKKGCHPIKMNLLSFEFLTIYALRLRYSNYSIKAALPTDCSGTHSAVSDHTQVTQQRCIMVRGLACPT